MVTIKTKANITQSDKHYLQIDFTRFGYVSAIQLISLKKYDMTYKK